MLIKCRTFKNNCPKLVLLLFPKSKILHKPFVQDMLFKDT